MFSKKKKKAEGFLDTIKTLVWALLLAGLIRTLFFQPYWIPSGSMKDTLLIGDFLFVNKMAYGYSKHSCPWSLCPFSGRILSKEPKRGDVVVFKHPTTGADFIKRLVGLPGEKIQMKDGSKIKSKLCVATNTETFRFFTKSINSLLEVPIASGEQGLELVRILEAANKSMSSNGAPVKI